MGFPGQISQFCHKSPYKAYYIETKNPKLALFKESQKYILC